MMQFYLRMSTIKWITILSFFILLDTCWSKPGLFDTFDSDGATDQATELVWGTERSNTNMDFTLGFSSFESRMKIYVDNVKRGQLSIMSNTSIFLEEVGKYLNKLPITATKIVTTKSRDVCHCEGQMMSPCPARCMYSCYLTNDEYKANDGWHYVDDCRYMNGRDCKCAEDSATSCYRDEWLESCINETTEVLPVHTTCSQYLVDKEKLVEAFRLVHNLLMEPLNKYFRGVESRLFSFKQASLSIISLSEIATQVCSEENETNCTAQAKQLLSEEKTSYLQLKRNLTLDLIQTQSRIEAVSQKIDALKELTFAKINRSIKEYSCCLKILDFSIDGYDCSDVNIDPNLKTVRGISTTIPTPEAVACGPTTFTCKTGGVAWVGRDQMCDGTEDCEDGSDEINCIFSPFSTEE